jgi:hypothetical protein
MILVKTLQCLQLTVNTEYVQCLIHNRYNPTVTDTVIIKYPLCDITSETGNQNKIYYGFTVSEYYLQIV